MGPARCAPAPPVIRRCARSIRKPSTCRRFGNNPRRRPRPLPECIASRSVAPAGRGGGGGGGGFGRGGGAPPPADACTAGAPAPAADSAAAGGRGGRGGRGGGRGGRGGAAGLQPGQYSVRLTVDGQSYTQPVTIKPDPRNAASRKLTRSMCGERQLEPFYPQPCVKIWVKVEEGGATPAGAAFHGRTAHFR